MLSLSKKNSSADVVACVYERIYNAIIEYKSRVNVVEGRDH